MSLVAASLRLLAAAIAAESIAIVTFWLACSARPTSMAQPRPIIMAVSEIAKIMLVTPRSSSIRRWDGVAGTRIMMTS